MKTVAYIPMKLNNERTPGKNTKRFSDGTPLCQLLQKTLLQVPEIDEVVVYCSDDAIKDYLLPGVKYVKRPTSLDTKETLFGDIFEEFQKVYPADIYVLAHVTCPFIKAERFSASIQAVLSGKFDSAFSGKRVMDFLWQDGTPLNFDRGSIPRTQDLPLIYSETTSFYVFTPEVFSRFHGRVGSNPYVCECNEIESIDIDWPEDFIIADAVYNRLKSECK